MNLVIKRDIGQFEELVILAVKGYLGNPHDSKAIEPLLE